MLDADMVLRDHFADWGRLYAAGEAGGESAWCTGKYYYSTPHMFTCHVQSVVGRLEFTGSSCRWDRVCACAVFFFGGGA